MITILKPGLLTSIQDLGRYGYQKFGIVTSGVMDQIAHRVANILVGNSEKDPTLEMTLLGPTIKFHKDSLISICGGNMNPEIDGNPIKCWRPILIRKESILKFGSSSHGCRAYLAIAGGLDIPFVMKSKSTYFRAEIGGYNGRALKKGDCIPFSPLSKRSLRIFSSLKDGIQSKQYYEAKWIISADILPHYRENPTIRVMKGRQFHLFNQLSQSKLFSEPFLITPQSDRMGYRIKGPTLVLNEDKEMISEALCFGTIQVPADGNPIVLLADRQTTGGYPKIAQIAAVDLPLIAQARPGTTLRFIEITPAEAQLLFIQREQKLNQLKLGISLKYR